MPERQIPWRQVAHQLGGTFEAKTYSTQTRFILQALVDGQHLEVEGRSAPYAHAGNHTRIRVQEHELRGFDVDVIRERERASFWRNLLWRDVEVGDTRFDSDWFLRAKRDADAQLVLDPVARRLIQAVPPALPRVDGDEGLPRMFYEKGYSTTGIQKFAPMFYDFTVANGEARAESNGLEASVERMHAAIAAVVGLSKFHERLAAQWKQLAKDLDGRLESTSGWRADNGTRVVFALQGMPVSISLVVHKGRLYCRATCTCAPGHRPLQKPITPAHQRDAQTHGPHMESAMAAARPARVFQDANTMCAELAGHITDVPRLVAAASIVTTLARARDVQGPYR